VAAEEKAKPLSIVAQLLFVGLAALLVYSFVAVTREGELRRLCSAPCILHPNYLGADRVAPDFDLVDLGGQHRKLSDYRGKVVWMNFWTRTCGPCMQEMPEIAELARILEGKKDVAMLAVSIDDSAEEIEPLLKSVLSGPPPFTVLIDPDSMVVGGKYGTKLFPETWVIDKRGVIRARFDGAKSWSDASVVEFIDELRRGDYCPVSINGGVLSGKAGKLCEADGNGASAND
jgi:thiol-disulfide isomerase/thioredoxin